MPKLAILLTVCLVILVAGCTPEHPQSTLDAKGPGAERLLTLFWIILWAAVVVGVAVGGALLYTVIRYRRRPGQGDPQPIHGSKWLEIAWTIAPALVLVVIAVPTISAIFHISNSPDPDGLEVRVVGHQWWWEFDYTNLEPKVVTANELHIPAGRVVNLTLETVDVIHSFWIPKLMGKVDVIPNRKNTMWIQADEPGTYIGQCAEFCGVAHANMQFRVIAHPEAEFDAWIRGQQTPADAPTGLAAEGANLFLSEGCVGCHKIQGMGGDVGPDLTHFDSRGIFIGGVLENDPEGANLALWLRDPESVKEGNIMSREAGVYTVPDQALTADEIGALVAYLKSLK